MSTLHQLLVSSSWFLVRLVMRQQTGLVSERSVCSGRRGLRGGRGHRFRIGQTFKV